MPSPEELATQAEYYLNALDLASEEYEFLRLDREAYQRSVFMDHRIRSGTQEPVRASLDSIQKLVARLPLAPAIKPINYIFHTAFCCSTLISRCLAIEGICNVLREPSVLMQMANYKRVGNPYFLDAGRQQTLLNTVLFLLTKTAGEGETTLIKPTNAANNLAVEIVRHKRTHCVLLLYSNLEQFLVSIIKKGEEGRAFVRKLFNVIRMDSERTSALSMESLSQLTDLQIAAFAWYLQIDTYLKLIDSYPSANLRTLDCDAFLADPVGTLRKLCDYFGMTVKTRILEDIVMGPVFRKYSKNDVQNYDASVRAAENARIAEQYRTTINGILAWSDHIRPEGPVLLPLPRAL